jgi:hypothetical protein
MYCLSKDIYPFTSKEEEEVEVRESLRHESPHPFQSQYAFSDKHTAVVRCTCWMLAPRVTVQPTGAEYHVAEAGSLPLTMS